MVMILQFNRDMNQFNKFLKKLYSSPTMLWKGGAGLIFFCFSLALVFVPTINIGLAPNSRYAFAGLIMLYALFRLYSCYAEYKSYGDE